MKPHIYIPSVNCLRSAARNRMRLVVLGLDGRAVVVVVVIDWFDCGVVMAPPKSYARCEKKTGRTEIKESVNRMREIHRTEDIGRYTFGERFV